MQPKPEEVHRKMVPRWRGFLNTPAKELISSVKSRPRIAIPVGVEEAAANWLADHNPWTASEIVSASFIVGKTNESDLAARYLLEHEDVVDGLKSLARSYFKTDPGPYDVYTKNIDVPDQKAAHTLSIGRLKRLIINQPRNAILYVEVARHYVSLGQVGPAEQNLRRALALAPNNRFIVRSSARFFVHEQNFDAAWDAVKNVSKSDPWLMACRITAEELSGNRSTSTRTTSFLLNGGDPSQVTELAAAVATSELATGNLKSARRLFRQSAEQPTDNTVAQLRWASEFGGAPFDVELLKTERSYEARTTFAVREQRWEEAVRHCREWVLDEPFSARAAEQGCYISAEFTRDFQAAIWFADFGLLANPSSLTFLNNKAYALANLGRTNEARSIAEIIKAKVVPVEDLIYITATMGCASYVDGDPIRGAELYKESIELAIEAENYEAAVRGYIHWIYEEVRAGRRLSAELADMLRGSAPKFTGIGDMRNVYAVYLSPLLDAADYSAGALGYIAPDEIHDRLLALPAPT